jgi:hypothetical protein
MMFIGKEKASDENQWLKEKYLVFKAQNIKNLPVVHNTEFSATSQYERGIARRNS